MRLGRKIKKIIKIILISIFFPFSIFFILFGYKFFKVNYNFAIGHLIIEPYFYLKEINLGLIKRKKTILLIPRSKITKNFPHVDHIAANKTLLDLWKQHFIVISSPWIWLLLWPFSNNPLIRISANYCDTLQKSKIFQILNCEQERKIQDKAIVKLNEHHIRKGRENLRNLGITYKDWYVCIYCREPGFYSIENINGSTCRCSDINELYLSCKEIIHRGGWVIRMGSKNMNLMPKKFQSLQKVIDYPKTSYVSEEMDLFLASRCRFFLGSSSGIIGMARLFSRPSVIVNTIPFTHSGFGINDLAIPKLYKKNGEFISFKTILSSPLANFMRDNQFKKYDSKIEIIDNSAEDIRDIVVEMLDMLERKKNISQDEENLQKRFKSLLKPHNFCYQTPIRFGSSFLKKYSFLMQ